MKKNKEHWIKSPWTISIAPVVLSFLLSLFSDWLKGKPILTTIWNIFNWITNLVWCILNFDLKVWLFILIIIVVFILIMLYRIIFKSKSKKEKSMLKAIKRVPSEMGCKINGTKEKFLFKFDPKVIKEKYHFDNMRPYCLNCSSSPLRMTEGIYGSFRCNCGKEVDNDLIRDIESRIITELEKNELL